MSIDLAIVPVAGQGTRLLPSTKSQPKEMLPVGRKPVVQYVVEELALSGIKRLLFITGPGKTSIENHFDVNGELIAFLRETGKEELLEELAFERQHLEYFYTRQRRQLGLGHAVLCARPLVGMQPFVVALGDSILGINAQSDVVRRMTSQFEEKAADAVIAFEEVPAEDVVHYGIAKPKHEGTIFELDDIVEKPAVKEAPSRLAVAARYVFAPVIFDHIAQTTPGKGGEIQLTDAIRRLIKHGGKVIGLKLGREERRFDIGNFESYFRAFVEFALADPRVRRVRPGRPAPRGGTANFRPIAPRRHGELTMLLLRRQAHARAGLVGNPSDGYHGKTLSLIVRNFRAEVVLYEWEDVEILWTDQDQSCFRSVHDLVRDVQLHGYYGGVRLVKATIKKFVEFCQRQGLKLHDRNFSVRYTSNIPRQVGLAGSSAIIVATLRCLIDYYGVSIPREVQPSLALAVETQELGITGGLQDRVIQVHEGLVYMDFAPEQMQEQCGYLHGRYECLDPRLLPNVYIAYSTEEGEPTEVFHNDIRGRFNRGEPSVVQAMGRCAALAAQAREALAKGDLARLNRCIDDNFEQRRSIYKLPTGQVAMIETARSVGASANFAGSGGAIVGLYRDEAMFEELQQTLGKQNCEVIRPQFS